MSIRSAGIILMTVLLAGCASGPKADVTGQRIRVLEQQQALAAIARDRAALEKIFAPDFQIVNPSGAVATKEELLALLLGGTSPYRSAVYQTDTVRVYRDVVVTTGLETVVPNTGALAGQIVRRRFTHVWLREGSDWGLALRHATIVAP